MENRRNQTLDLIKIIAMFSVVGAHVFINHYDTPLGSFLDNNLPIICIPLFFMVSGYLMARKEDVSWKYALGKIWGIVRFVTTIVLITCMLKWEEPTLHRLYDPYLQKGAYYPVFWYFGAMIILYALSPVLIRIIRSKALNYVIGGLAVVGTVVFALNHFYNFEANVIQTFRLYHWIMYFLLGALCYKKKLQSSTPYLCLASGAVFELFVYFIRHQHPDEFFRLSFFYGSPFCILFAVATFCYLIHFEIKDNKIIDELSKLFLPVYTIHVPLIFFLLAHPFLGDFPGAVLVDYAVVCSISFGISFLIMKTKVGKWIFRV